jgi:hypothetical protein
MINKATSAGGGDSVEHPEVAPAVAKAQRLEERACPDTSGHVGGGRAQIRGRDQLERECFVGREDLRRKRVAELAHTKCQSEVVPNSGTTLVT